MVMKVCYHNFIFVIYGHKVGTWKRQRRQRAEERTDESSIALKHMRGSSTLFLDFEKTRHTVVTKILLSANVEQYVRYNRADGEICKKTKRLVTFTGN